MNILVTGGLGFIGSHTIIELSKSNYNIIVIDNLSNSSVDIIDKIEKMIYPIKIKVIIGDINNSCLLDSIFSKNNIYAVIHFAGLKAVGESVSKPLLYYDNNISSTIQLLNIMNKHNVKRIIFSSSATVYGSQPSPLTEDTIAGMNLTNPYGRTKYFIEEILKDLKDWNIIILRYFNPIGAHESGIIGENPNGIPNNLMPFILKVAKNHYLHEKNPVYNKLKIFGNDYKTIDGTGVRDYIHVVDLAIAHIKSLKYIIDKEKKSKLPFVNIYNIGTGKGTSVLELIKIFENINKIKIPYEIHPRRLGDVDICYCSANKALKELKWKPYKTINDMCKDSWNYIIKSLKTETKTKTKTKNKK